MENLKHYQHSITQFLNEDASVTSSNIGSVKREIGLIETHLQLDEEMRLGGLHSAY
jgi:hypothetical protein